MLFNPKNIDELINKITKLVVNADLRVEISKNARNYVIHRSWDEEILKGYQEVLNITKRKT